MFVIVGNLLKKKKKQHSEFFNGSYGIVYFLLKFKN